jgi:three-Cys-motif partner protein
VTPPRETIWPLEPHTVAKHAILEDYLKAWFPILAKNRGRIVYYDGFAGPGRYSKGEDGSPVVALKVALNHKLPPTTEVVFAFVERRPDRADHLESELAALPLPKSLCPEVIRSDFAEALSSTLDLLDKKDLTLAPTFAFIDPFGITGLPFSLIKRLLQGKSCEVLITFMSETIRRFDTVLPGQVDDLIGVPGAAASIAKATDRVAEARKLYEAQLRTAAKFVRFFAMRDQSGQTIYDLFFASNNRLGHLRMKETMWRVDATGTFSFSDGAIPAQQTLFTPTPEKDFADPLWCHFRGKTVDAVDILRYTCDETAYIEKHARGALRLLENAPASARHRITVSGTKCDGSKRHGRTFKGTMVTFVDDGGTS